jgi:ParB-like chromosome segregation protein Spo0J
MPKVLRQDSSFASQLSLDVLRAKATKGRYQDLIRPIIEKLSQLPVDERISAINEIRESIHAISPMKNEPVDFVRWIPSEDVTGNEYNPNSVAPPEMKLLELSIQADGFTQPVVAWQDEGKIEVIDGFHRNRVGKESKLVRERIMGYLPVVIANANRVDKSDRMAATVRHNRARGKHKVEGMSDIVVELKRRNWSTERICRELGMDQDEVLRLMQITGLEELFSDQEFSRSWDVEGQVTEDDFKELTDRVEDYAEEVNGFRTVNTSDPGRIFHRYETWECYKAGFYATCKEGMTKGECENAYRDFLSDTQLFSDTLEHVISEWKHSCEHYLTNVAMNRIAWLGQASACYALGIPAVYRAGFNLLSPEQQVEANEAALTYLNKWLEGNGRESVTMDEAISGERQSDIY